MSRFLATIVVPLATGDRSARERVIAERRVASSGEAEAWLRTNRESWRDALGENEPLFEMWVTDARRPALTSRGERAPMIRTLTEQSHAGVRRTAQIVCDGCGITTDTVEISAAATDAAVELAAMRKHAGFVEHGRRAWLGAAAPQRIGEQAIRDFCPPCAGGRKEM